jgi:hypothetical protein
MRFLIALLSGLLFVFNVVAENLYVAQTATGTGTSVALATNFTFFNTAGNWGAGAGKISSGDTVWICGVVGTNLSVQASGSLGSPITIAFDTNAVMRAGYWLGGGAITVSGFSNIVIDGFYNGIIEATNNGSAGLGYPNATYSVGIYATDAQDLEIKNLTIQNMYVRTNTDNTATCCGANHDSTNAIEIWGNMSRLSIHNNLMHDCGTGVNVIYPNATTINTINVFSNTVYHASVGVQIGSASTDGTVNDPHIYSNEIYDGYPWLDPSDQFHAHLIMVWAETTGNVINRLKIYNNYTHGNWDPGSHVTAHIFLACSFATPFKDTEIFNNVMTISSNSTPGNGVIEIQGGTQGLLIANNTILGVGPGYGIEVRSDVVGNSNIELYNNVVSNFDRYISMPIPGMSNANRNLYFAGSSKWYLGGTNYPTLGTWQALNYDLNGLETNPNLDASYKPQTGGPAVDAGITLTNFTTDRIGTSRPQGSAWDIGAYELITGGGPSPTYYFPSPRMRRGFP